MNGFSGANIKRLDHFITPNLVEDQSEIMIIHIGSNDTTHNTVDQMDVKDIVNRIMNIRKKCLSYGVKEVIISSMFIKKQFKLTRIIRQVNPNLGRGVILSPPPPPSLPLILPVGFFLITQKR